MTQHEVQRGAEDRKPDDVARSAQQASAGASESLRDEAVFELASRHSRSKSFGDDWDKGPHTMLAPGQGWDNSIKANNMRYRCEYGYDIDSLSHRPGSHTTICANKPGGGGTNFHPGLGVFELMLTTPFLGV
jgi:hypothetical protein